jgi:multiple antibiotic resistance protein
MENLVTFSITVFTGFFAIMNPIANTPIFLGLVEGKDTKTKRNIAKKGTLTAFIIVTLFVILGKYIFELFGITIPAFKISGGLLIFYVGFEMLMSQKSKVHTNDTEDDGSSLAISPLAIPILAGPGTIVTAMNYVTNATYIHTAIVIMVFAFMILLTYLAFELSDKIVKLVGSNLIAVIGKIMGLILAIIGTGMVIEGIKLAF